jgi:GNAT superfamily N-acetyltransferase
LVKKKRALKNNLMNASKTFVVHKDNIVLGYYALATGSVTIDKAPGKVRRNMPNPIPVMILGRLAVHLDFQTLGIGKGLLKDAVLRTIKVSNEVGVRALLTHAISDNAKCFYKRFGFIESPLDDMTLMLPIHDIEKYF